MGDAMPARSSGERSSFHRTPTMTTRLATFDDWNPAQYLADYYSRVEPDEQRTLKFLVQEFARIPGRPVALEFGIGPTLHHALPLSPHVREIHVADYLPSNLSEIRKWQAEDEAAHDWAPFTASVLRFEGIGMPTARDIRRREALTRRRITRLIVGDAASSTPLGAASERKYGCVLSCYCADSATGDKATWRRYMTNIVSLLAPGGFFVTAALASCRHYRVGGKRFPCANVNEHDFATLFQQLRFDMSTAVIRVEPVPEHRDLGYGSIVLASGFASR